MNEIKWRKPSIEATKHRHIVANYSYITEEGDEEECIDIFTFDTIFNIWKDKNGRDRLNLKEMKGWIPIPETENE